MIAIVPTLARSLTLFFSLSLLLFLSPEVDKLFNLFHSDFHAMSSRNDNIVIIFSLYHFFHIALSLNSSSFSLLLSRLSQHGLSEAQASAALLGLPNPHSLSPTYHLSAAAAAAAALHHSPTSSLQRMPTHQEYLTAAAQRLGELQASAGLMDPLALEGKDKKDETPGFLLMSLSLNWMKNYNDYLVSGWAALFTFWCGVERRMKTPKT